MDFGKAFKEWQEIAKPPHKMEEQPHEQKQTTEKAVEPFGHSISQSNKVTNSKRVFDVVEQRCFYLIVDTLRNGNRRASVCDNLFDDNLTISMTSEYLAKATDVKKVRRAFESLKKLRDKGIEIETDDGLLLYVGLINWATYSPRNKQYEIEVSKKIIPYLVELSKQFTTYQLAVAMAFKSKYSQRFYEFCNEYKNQEGNRFFLDIAKLRTWLNLENEYKLYSGFRENVLNKAQKEIKTLFDEGRCDLWFDYYEDETTKKGKAYTRIWFQVHTKTDTEQREKELNDRFYRRLWIVKFLQNTFKRDKKYQKRIVNAIDKDPELVEPIYTRLYRMVEDEKTNSHAALARYILKNDFGLK